MAAIDEQADTFKGGVLVPDHRFTAVTKVCLF